MSMLERKDSKDYICLYNTNNWKLIKVIFFSTKKMKFFFLKKFKVENSLDLIDLKWSNDDSILCTWDICLDYKIFFFRIDGKLLFEYKAYEYALGIKNVVFSPLKLVAISSFDQKVRILNLINWKIIGEFDHTIYSSFESVVN